MSEDLEIGEVDADAVEAASRENGFKDMGSVSLTGADNYLELDASEFAAVLKMFSKIALTSGDILSRSVRLEVQESFVTLKATDGLCFMEARLDCKNNGFDQAITFEVNSVLRIATMKANKFYFILEDDEVYADFFAGKIYIPTFPIDPMEFNCQFKSKKDVVVDKIRLKEVLNAHKGIVAKVEVPELSYIFLEEDGIFSSDSLIASKVTMEMAGKVVLRQRDVDLVVQYLELIRISTKELKIKMSKDRIRFQCEHFWVMVPQVQSDFSEQYKKALNIDKVTAYFYVDVHSLRSLVQVLRTMPQDSGILTLRTTDETLFAEAKTKKGKASEFILSTSVEKKPKPHTIKIGLDILSRALGLFSGDSSAKVAIDEKTVYFFNDEKTQVILLRR